MQARRTVAMAAVMRVIGSLAICALAVAPTATLAQDATPNAGAARAALAGKQVRFFTMGGPGGGYDTYMRALIPPLEKRLGARLVPINEPGAGGLVAMTRIIGAPPDALTVGLVGGEAIVTAQLYNLPGVHYDLRTLVWLGRISAEAKVLLFNAASRFKSLADTMKSDKPVIWGGTGKADGNSDFSAVLAHATGMKTRIVLGYSGSGGINLAIENGEIDGRVVSDESAVLFTRSNKMSVIAILARTRAEQFPGIATVFEQIEIAPKGARMLDWRAGVAALGRLLVTTPGAPADRVAALRLALTDVLADAEVVTEIKRRGLTPGFAPASQVQSMVAKAMDTLDDAALSEMRNVVMERYY